MDKKLLMSLSMPALAEILGWYTCNASKDRVSQKGAERIYREHEKLPHKERMVEIISDLHDDSQERRRRELAHYIERVGHHLGPKYHNHLLGCMTSVIIDFERGRDEKVLADEIREYG